MKTTVLVASALLASLLTVATARAERGYVTDSRGTVVKSGNGLCWRTGYWTPGMATAECDPELAPKPKQAEPAPARTQTPAPAPAQPTARSLSIASDGLFAFGKAALLPKGKAKLDQEVVQKIQGHPFDQITVIGHTDRLGSPRANERLSVKRAEAVKAYLVSKKIDGRLIRVEGKGSSQPVTKPDQCPGKGGPKLIACLQPDRRVEVLVSGLK